TTVMDKLNLNLTQDEIEHLTTLISKGEKQRRNTSYQKEKRRKKGVKVREEYLEREQEKKKEKRIQLTEAMKSNPKASQRQLARILGISESY
ncbi:hypothetical protein ACUOA9_38290, partial [Escherichia sp. HC-TM1]